MNMRFMLSTRPGRGPARGAGEKSDSLSVRALRCWTPMLCAGALAVAGGCLRAGEFINLTFDDPDLSHAHYFQPPIGGYDYPKWFAPVQEAFRGWTVGGGLVWAPYQGMATSN